MLVCDDIYGNHFDNFDNLGRNGAKKVCQIQMRWPYTSDRSGPVTESTFVSSKSHRFKPGLRDFYLFTAMFLRFGLLSVRNPQFSIQTRHFSLSNRLRNSPTKLLIPIAKWNRGPKALGYYIGLKDGATMSDVLGEIQGCEYKMKYTSDELRDAFAGLLSYCNVSCSFFMMIQVNLTIKHWEYFSRVRMFEK